MFSLCVAQISLVHCCILEATACLIFLDSRLRILNLETHQTLYRCCSKTQPKTFWKEVIFVTIEIPSFISHVPGISIPLCMTLQALTPLFHIFWLFALGCWSRSVIQVDYRSAVRKFQIIDTTLSIFSIIVKALRLVGTIKGLMQIANTNRPSTVILESSIMSQ